MRVDVEPVPQVVGHFRATEKISNAGSTIEHVVSFGAAHVKDVRPFLLLHFTCALNCSEKLGAGDTPHRCANVFFGLARK
jgi:hypothetical protein